MEAIHEVTDPDGRRVVFDFGSHLHLALGHQSELLDEIDAIMTAVTRPDHHEDDPQPGRERFFLRHAFDPQRWLRVVVDFNEEPAWVVTAFVQGYDPRR